MKAKGTEKPWLVSGRGNTLHRPLACFNLNQYGTGTGLTTSLRFLTVNRLRSGWSGKMSSGDGWGWVGWRWSLAGPDKVHLGARRGRHRAPAISARTGWVTRAESDGLARFTEEETSGWFPGARRDRATNASTTLRPPKCLPALGKKKKKRATDKTDHHPQVRY